MSQASCLRAESSGLSDASHGLDTEQSAQDVLADILGDFGGSPPRSARPSAPSSLQGNAMSQTSSPPYNLGYGKN